MAVVLQTSELSARFEQGIVLCWWEELVRVELARCWEQAGGVVSMQKPSYA